MLSLVLTPRPTCAFFPYTTLFRSGLAAVPRAGHGAGGGHRVGPGCVPGRPPEVHGHLSRRVPRPPRVPDGVDRKSTRLNSSHVEISYAVFCLKKKTDNGTASCQRL